MFDLALAAKVRPALSDVSLKAAFGRGRVHLCLSQAGAADHWSDAERDFEQVVDSYLKGNQRVRELAAESYANLGLVHLPSPGDPDAGARYRRAEIDYAKAVDLTRDESRKAFFLSMRGFILGRLGEKEEADEAYRQAISLERDAAARTAYERARRTLAEEVR